MDFKNFNFISYLLFNMELYFKYLITKHIYVAYLFIFLVSFLESLAFLGFLVPSSLVMFLVGFFIGKKIINFYYSYLLVVFGCILGDVISYYVGNYYRNYLFLFRKKISNYINIFEYIFKYFKKNFYVLIISSKFTGPMKSFFFFISGMLNISIKKIFIPNFLSTLLWVLFFFTPGILSGLALILPNSFNFKINLFSFIFLFIINIYIFLKWFNINKKLSVFLFIILIFLCLKHLFLLVNDDIFYLFVKLMYSLFI